MKQEIHGAPVMAWPASGLNPSLAESVEGFLRNVLRYGHKPPCIVSFDRPLSEIDPELISRLRDISSETECSISLMDLGRRAEIREILNKRAERKVLDYALYPSSDGIGYGCNTNLNLLLSAGCPLISSDDDIFCRPTRPAGAEPPSTDVTPSTEYYPGELRYRPDRDAVLNCVNETEVDIIGEYLRFLGQRPKALIHGMDDEPGRVLIVSPGTYGDSCMSGQSSLLKLHGRSREFLMEDYENLRFSRELIRIPRHNALSRSPQFIMAQSGFDNSVPIPPFPTYGRNPEGLSLFLTRLIYPGAFTLFPAFGLLHSPSGIRVTDRESLYAYTPSLSSLIMAAALYCRPGDEVTNIDRRFEILGSGIMKIGKLRAGDFTESLHSALSTGLQNYVHQMEKILDKNDREPALWVEDVDRHLDSVFTLLREPRRMFGSEGCGLSLERAQYHFIHYGRLLSLWPSLHQKMFFIDPSLR